MVSLRLISTGAVHLLQLRLSPRPSTAWNLQDYLVAGFVRSGRRLSNPFGDLRALREAVLGFYTKSHLCDPWQASVYKRLTSLRRLLTWVPDAKRQFERIWHACFHPEYSNAEIHSIPKDASKVHGMIGLIAEDIQAFGWDWSFHPYAFHRPKMQPLPLCGTSKG